MAPIEKNVIVTDENGKIYETTYLRRAKGLVKNGRARFLNENTICLACPVAEMTEDKFMSENSNNKIQAQSNEIPETLSVEYVLKRIDKIIDDTAYIHDIIEKLGENQFNAETGHNGGYIGIQSRNDALAKVVMCRETTNQQILKFLEKMYDDLKPKSATVSEPGSDEQRFAAICESLKNLNPDNYSPEILELLKKSAQQMFVKPYAAVV